MTGRPRRNWKPFFAGVAATLVGLSVFAAGIGFASSRYQDLALFSSVLNYVRQHYVELVDEHQLLTGAVNGMLRELDPHSSFLDHDAYKEMQVDTRGEFHGLGIEITKRQGEAIEIVSPIDGTPAHRAGIKSRDRIISICPSSIAGKEEEECQPTKNMAILEAVKLMRGRKGTKITIHIFREGFDAPRPFTVERDVVKIHSVESRVLEPGFGYLRVSAFQERTEQELEASLASLHDEIGESFKGLIVDLRDNPGGLLDQAVRVADAWLEGGLIVYTQGREEAHRQEYAATAPDTEPDYPIVVLVNEGSASASEIVAGAMQDQRRALVLGVDTFGKGSVQTVYPLEGGAALRLTTALYYTPSGRSIQETGIRPDIIVEVAPERLASRDAPRRLRERDLEGHFTQDDARSDHVTTPSDPEPDTQESGVDPQLDRGLEVLKSWRYFDRLRAERGAVNAAARLQDDPSAAESSAL